MTPEQTAEAEEMKKILELSKAEIRRISMTHDDSVYLMLRMQNIIKSLQSERDAYKKENCELAEIAIQRRRDQETLGSRNVNWAFRVAEERGYITAEQAKEIVTHVLNSYNSTSKTLSSVTL